MGPWPLKIPRRPFSPVLNGFLEMSRNPFKEHKEMIYGKMEALLSLAHVGFERLAAVRVTSGSLRNISVTF